MMAPEGPPQRLSQQAYSRARRPAAGRPDHAAHTPDGVCTLDPSQLRDGRRGAAAGPSDHGAGAARTRQPSIQRTLSAWHGLRRRRRRVGARPGRRQGAAPALSVERLRWRRRRRRSRARRGIAVDHTADGRLAAAQPANAVSESDPDAAESDGAGISSVRLGAPVGPFLSAPASLPALRARAPVPASLVPACRPEAAGARGVPSQQTSPVRIVFSRPLRPDPDSRPSPCRHAPPLPFGLSNMALVLILVLPALLVVPIAVLSHPRPLPRPRLQTRPRPRPPRRPQTS